MRPEQHDGDRHRKLQRRYIGSFGTSCDIDRRRKQRRFINSSELSGGVNVEVGLPGDAVAGDTLVITDGVTPQTIVLTSTDISNGVVSTTFASPGDGNTVTVSATLTDVAGNTSGSGSDSALVDITPPVGTITLDANITADDVINAAEAGSVIAVTGSVTGDIQDGDTVSLTVNGTVYTGAVSGGAFSIDVAGSDLASDSDATIVASVTTTDSAGNSTTVTDSESYSVDTTSTPAPVVSIIEDANDDDGLTNRSL